MVTASVYWQPPKKPDTEYVVVTDGEVVISASVVDDKPRSGNQVYPRSSSPPVTVRVMLWPGAMLVVQHASMDTAGPERNRVKLHGVKKGSCAVPTRIR